LIRIRWTPAALNNFKTISHRIEQERNLATANRVCRAIYDAIQILRRHPYSGKRGIEEGTRELVISKSPYVAAYRVIESEAIQILRIWRGAQNR
jgi:addiction module RelE/StbE family toxin